ncbi:MAG: ATP-binding cassette domain-containing protein [Lacunisphaera sp.]
MSGPLVSVRDLKKSYDNGRVPVLAGVSLEIQAGEMVALWGSSGSGKSTLLHLMGGLDVPDSGEIAVCGRDPRREADRLELRRRHIGFVFQLHNLIADLTVEENVRVPALANNRPPAETAARGARARRGRRSRATGSTTASRIFPAASASARPSAAR